MVGSFEAYAFEPLEFSDGALAQRLAEQFAAHFLAAGELDPTRVGEVAEMVSFERGTASNLDLALKISFSMLGSTRIDEWDGSAPGAESIVEDAASNAGEQVGWDQIWGPTGLEAPGRPPVGWQAYASRGPDDAPGEPSDDPRT